MIRMLWLAAALMYAPLVMAFGQEATPRPILRAEQTRRVRELARSVSRKYRDEAPAKEKS